VVDLALGCSVFFFSSRRRHTRSKRDWSSDVCSSDLTNSKMAWILCLPTSSSCGATISPRLQAQRPLSGPLLPLFGAGYRPSCGRSEERRVGKECGVGKWTDLRKEKNSVYAVEDGERR